jgi:hypothetical protein
MLNKIKHWAAGAGHSDSVDWLLRKGANPLAATHTWTRNYFSTGSGQSPVHWAAQVCVCLCVCFNFI